MLNYRRAVFVYEAARLEAIASLRPIVPEPWEHRDEAFRKQFRDTIARICTEGYETTPESEHDSWWKAYARMGWKYGAVRDTVLKTHPDMVPFNELPLLERQKDVIFLDICAMAYRWVR